MTAGQSTTKCLVPHELNVGAGLLAKAVYQPMNL